MQIIVFGAGGFMGGWICELFSESGEHGVVGCIRGWSSAVRIARRGITISRVDMRDSSQIAAILTGADVVVNASMPPPEMEEEMASMLYEASTKFGVRRFIQFSSAAVYGNQLGNISEDMATAPTDSYGRGKVAMENRLLEMATKKGPQLFILRPSIIYGPFSEAWTVRYARRIVSKRWRTLGRLGEGSCNLIHAKDVARSVLAAATADVGAGSHVLNLNGPDMVSWNEYIEQFGNAIGLQSRNKPNYLDFILRVVIADFVRKGGRLAKRYFATPLAAISRSAGVGRGIVGGAKSFAGIYPTRDELKLLGRKCSYSSRRAEQVLKFAPTITLEEGLLNSSEWCRIHGVL